VTLTATTLAGLTFDGGGGSPEERALTPTTRRPDLCIQVLELDEAGEPVRGDPQLELLVESRVRVALIEAAKHPYWAAGLPPPGYLFVDVGCPSPPLPLLTDVAWEEGYPAGYVEEGLVTAPGPYRRYVYVMPLEQIDELLGGLTNRVAVQEIECAGDVCVGFTWAIYLSAEETEDTPFLVETLQHAFGLRPVEEYEEW